MVGFLLDSMMGSRGSFARSNLTRRQLSKSSLTIGRSSRARSRVDSATARVGPCRLWLRKVDPLTPPRRNHPSRHGDDYDRRHPLRAWATILDSLSNYRCFSVFGPRNVRSRSGPRVRVPRVVRRTGQNNCGGSAGNAVHRAPASSSGGMRHGSQSPARARPIGCVLTNRSAHSTPSPRVAGKELARLFSSRPALTPS